MDFAIQYTLAEVRMEFGCPKEWKGDWDRVLGMLAGVWEEACEVQEFKHIHEVVHLFQTWATEMMEKDPPEHGGWEWHIEEFFPKDKSTYAFTKLASPCLMNVRDNYSWSFRCNDKRAMQRKSFAKTSSPFNLMYLTVKNHGLTGCPAYRTGTGVADDINRPDDPADTAAIEPNEIPFDTQDEAGWRVSWVKNGMQKRHASRRACLKQQYDNRTPFARNLPEVHPTRTLEQQREGAERVVANRKKRTQQLRAWRIANGEQLRKLKAT